MLQPVDGAPKVSVDRVPSRYLSVYLTLVHGCLLVSLYIYPLSLLFTALFSIPLLWHWKYSLRRYNSTGCHQWISRLQSREEGLYLWQNNTAVPVVVEQATLWSWLIAASFRHRDTGQRYSVLFFPDSAAVEQQRQLRVLLRHCLSAGV